MGRGGDKLEAALDAFAIDVAGRRALDAGSSTGGFTDCLLQRGAAFVCAVDVGRAQLHERLRTDDRVRSLEGTDVRNLTITGAGGAPFDVVVGDLSFISLRAVAGRLAGPLAAPGASLVVLVKPQYEAGRVEASRGRGIIRDPAVWRRVLAEVGSSLWASEAAIIGAMPSPITGAEGNVEFFLHGRAHAAARRDPGPMFDEAVERAVEESAARKAGAQIPQAGS